MSYLRGIAKALFVYLAILIAIGIAIGFELPILIAGMKFGLFSEPRSSTGNLWMSALCVLVTALVGCQSYLPSKLKDWLSLHQLNYDGTPAGAEQLLMRSLLVVAYVVVVVTMCSNFPAVFAQELLPLTYFAILAPAVQIAVCKGQFSLVDYVLFARSSSAHSVSIETHQRELAVVVSLAISASIALVMASLTKDAEAITRIASVRSSNPGLFDSSVRSAVNAEFYQRPTVDKDYYARQQVSLLLSSSGIRILNSRRLGTTYIEGKDGDSPELVGELLEVQLALPSFRTDRTKAAFSDAANRICRSENALRASGEALGLLIRSYGKLDSFEFEIQKYFVCVQGEPKEMTGRMRVHLAFSATAQQEQ
jgi:hypothetical protein